jgi:hypothetical protein
MKSKQRRTIAGLVVTAFLITYLPQSCQGFAVMTHQAIIDFSWRRILKPHIQKRYPNATDGDLESSRAYAYGGGIIQDMGYFPFSNSFFSDLTHYVRTGDFVQALINDAQNVNEYAFALGALEHYCADTTGHPLATNRAVAIYFPPLKARFGDSVTYEDDQAAHSRAEFGFDVLQVAEHNYPDEDFHDRKGFKVAKDLLNRAFKETYGIELQSILKHENLTIWSYSESISKLMPHLTEITWKSKQQEILALYADLKRDRYVIQRTRIKTEDRPLGSDSGPTLFDKLAAFFVSIFTKRHPMSKLDVMIPTKATEQLFLHAWTETHEAYKKRIADIDAGQLHLTDLDFDTGEPTRIHEYRLADQAYGNLLMRLSKNNFQGIDNALKANILGFYGDQKGHQGKLDSRVKHALDKLRAVG